VFLKIDSTMKLLLFTPNKVAPQMQNGLRNLSGCHDNLSNEVIDLLITTDTRGHI
jgi:hypothetical protein